MIWFRAIVVAATVAMGLLIAGTVSGDLALVDVSIGLAALALLTLIVGVIVWRQQVFGRVGQDAEVGGAAAARQGAGERAGAGTTGEAGNWAAELVDSSRLSSSWASPESAGSRTAGQSAPVAPQERRDREPAGATRRRQPGSRCQPGRLGQPVSLRPASTRRQVGLPSVARFLPSALAGCLPILVRPVFVQMRPSVR